MRTLYTEGLDGDGFVNICEEILSAFYKSKTKRPYLYENESTDFLILGKDHISVLCLPPAKAPIGKTAIEKFYLAMKNKRVKEGIIVTNGRFATTAQKYVEDSNIPITLMEIEKLASVAFKAGIKLVYKKEEPEAYILMKNSDREFREHLSKKLKNSIKCTDDIALNLSIVKRDISLVLFYKIDYSVNAEFEASKKIIHKESGEGSCYISERYSKIMDDEFIEIYDMVPKMAYEPKGKEADLMKPRKQILDVLYDRVIEKHTKYIPIKTGPDKIVNKKCAPSKKDIIVQNVTCLFVPLSDTEYEMFGRKRTIQSLESGTENFFALEPKWLVCDVCDKKITGDIFLCKKCGKMTDDKHTAICSRCNTILCTECSLFISKFLGKNEPICPSCAEKEPGLKIKGNK
ncbi:restriction endonuclease [Candidatus Methanoplasma termitum]|uniref:Restriction endonuclease n=1 Tax=Candidatus Methanoplasma termitum TaxID=1577791 RepID=A0A0A7LAE0_9ARCH|nr:restriction endonuclease [Candidatus Methanoplasma termitum]AIZ56039.1 restriction endonuclease [Candidatus Methanoplasma termitum]MCL2333576.1 restriction endonuclease [Candidatus Methanoplasma sp.]